MENNNTNIIQNTLGSFEVIEDNQPVQATQPQEVTFQPLIEEQPAVNAQPQQVMQGTLIDPQPTAPQQQAPQPTPMAQPTPTPMPQGPIPSAVPTAAGEINLGTLLATTEAMDPAEAVYRKLPEGTHYVKFKEMEFTTTKAEKPIVWIKYEAVGGEHDGVSLAESFYLGGEEAWQVQRAIGNMKHRLEVDFGLLTLPWTSGNLTEIANATNALAAQLHFHATITYPVNAKTGEVSEYSNIDSIIKA